jgi:hypothetical protein
MRSTGRKTSKLGEPSGADVETHHHDQGKRVPPGGTRDERLGKQLGTVGGLDVIGLFGS